MLTYSNVTKYNNILSKRKQKIYDGDTISLKIEKNYQNVLENKKDCLCLHRKKD